MIVLGGGPVGSELAQAWSTLGTKVTLVEGERGLLPREEPFAGEQVEDSLRDNWGVEVRCACKATRFSRERRRRRRRARRRRAGSRRREILVAVGRKPRTEGIGLESVGLEPDAASSRSTTPSGSPGHDWLYAVGDVNGRALFTHMGKYQARIAGDRILGREIEAVAEDLGSPRVTFTDPQVAAVGKTLAQAKEAGLNASATDVETAGTAGRQLLRQGHRRHLAPRRRRGPQADRRRHLRRLRDRRLPPRGDGRDPRRGSPRPSLACDPGLPQPQRGLAEADGEVRPLDAWAARLAPAEAGQARQRRNNSQTVERRCRSSRTSCGKPGTSPRSATDL